MIRSMGLKRHFLALALSALLASATGCAWGQRDTADAGTPGPAPVEGAGTLLVQNHSEKSVFHLRWREIQSSKWSGDRLDEGDVIKPQQDRKFELPAGTYALRLELGDGANWSPEAPLQIRPDTATACVLPGATPAQLGTLTVVNNSAWAINHVRFSSSTEPGWGVDRLPVGAFLTAGKSRSWKVPAGQYQLQVEFQDGTTQESAAYDLTLGEETLFRIGNIRPAGNQ